MSGTLEKNIISPSEASGVVQSGFDFIDGLLPFGSVFPVKSNDGKDTVTWQKIIPPKETDAMKFRAWDAEAAHGKTVAQSGENYTGLIPLSKMGHISERDVINTRAIPRGCTTRPWKSSPNWVRKPPCASNWPVSPPWLTRRSPSRRTA